MENFTKETLYSLSIHQVREVARQCGVRSPSSQKKEDLIEQIMAISTGKMEKYVAKNKKGRPAKTIVGLDDYIDTFFPHKEFDAENFFDSTISVAAPNLFDEEVFSSAVKMEGEFEGYLDLIDGKIGVVRRQINDDDSKTAFISSTLIEKHNLRIGDKIVASTKLVNENKIIIHNIISINDGQNNINRNNFLEQSPVFPTQTINFKGDFIINNLCPIGFGQRTLVDASNYTVLKRFITKLFNEADGEKLLIFCDAQPEEALMFEDNKNIVCLCEGSLKQKLKMLKLATNILHRKAEQGKNTTLFVVGGQTIIDLASCRENGEMLICKDLLGAFKNTKNLGNCGLVLGIENKNEQLIERLNEKLFNLSISLCEDLLLFGVESCIDVKKLDIFREDGLLNEKKFDLLRKIKMANYSIEDLARVLSELK